MSAGAGQRPRRPLRLLADDLTGALDSAAAFAALGAPVPVGLGAPWVGGEGAGPPRVRGRSIAAVATATRDVPPEALPALLAPVQAWLAAGDPAFKKVDSLLRGNTLAECAWLARAGAFDGILFAPAFPLQHRLTWQGRHRLHAADDRHQRHAADDRPRAAAGTLLGPPLVEAFAALGWTGRVSAADDPPVVASVDDPATRGGTHGTVWIPDVRNDADLRRIARWALSDAPPGASRPIRRGRWLLCGSAGLAQALAAVLGAPTSDSTPGVRPAPPGGSAVRAGRLMLGASHHPVIRRQWARAREACPAALVVRDGDEAALASACHAMAEPFDLALLELAPREPLDATQARERLARQLAAIVGQVPRPAQLFVLGGDTLLGLCRAAGVQALQARPGLRPGWGRARLVGGCWDGLDTHTRSGAFGDDEDLVALLADAAAAPSGG